MGYWDYTPSSHHQKKPLTKAQIRRMQQSYEQADKISAEVRIKEKEEQQLSESNTEEMLRFL